MSTTTTTYGSITIVDITDVGEFSIYPMSNSPLSVVYDPNQEIYTPDWADDHLVLQPMIYYAGTRLNSNTSGLSVTWQRKDGVGAESSLTAGETVSGYNLTVSTNKLSESATGILTYICTATYIEPESQITLTASGQITFSLVKHAVNIKRCSIVGEGVFKYNADGVLVGSDYITLKATTNGVSINKWQYYNSNSTWVDYPISANHNTSINGETLNVYHTEDVFVNDMATIRVSTDNDSVYDICTVVKIRDGAAGSSTVAAVLSNDDQWVACDSNGSPLHGAFENATSTITIFEGGTDVTSSWKITWTPSGATGSFDSNTYTYTVSGISQVSANIEFKCEKTGYATLYKNFSLTKLVAAKDGDSPVIYSVTPSTLATNRTIDGKYTPSSVVFNSYSKTGNNDRVEYAGRFKIFTNNNTTPAYTSGSNETSCSYTFVGTNLTSVHCELYAAGGTSTLLDKQTIVVTSDGATGAPGETGADGQSAVNVVLGNQTDIIPCNSDGTAKSDMTLKIPFTGYLGISKTPCTVLASGLPSGMTVSKNTAGTESSGGELQLSVAKGSTLGGGDSGVITLSFTCQGSTIIHYYQWSKSIQAVDGINGINAVLFQIFAPQGNIIYNGGNDAVLEALLVDGATTVTSGVKYQWKKYLNGAYNVISGQTSSSLTVTPNDVSGYASYQCVAEYDNKEYSAYYAVYDKSDPIQAQVFCSLGTQILNGQGFGAVYTKIYRNGSELDPIKSERFLTVAPANAQNGHFYYHLNEVDKTATLMKYDGSSWIQAPASDLPIAEYTYTFRDKDGNVTNYNGNSTVNDKVFYVDGSLVDKKIVIDVEVSYDNN